MHDQLELAEDLTRASIVRFIEAEWQKFERAADEDFNSANPSVERRERLTAKAGALRTVAAYIARGDDLKVTP